MSKEFDNLLKTDNIGKSERLLHILDTYWDKKYSKYLEMKYQWYYYTDHSKTLRSSFIRDLKGNIRLPSTQNTLAKPSEIFLNEPEIQEVLGDTVPYLSVEIKDEDFIKAIGINTEVNVGGVLNHLKALTEQICTKKNKFEKLYIFLNKHFYDVKGIRQSFSNDPLIYIPDTEKMSFTRREVLWEDVSR